jgi:hypothetical protein
MISERVRAVLGVWTPMAIGLVIIATAINFYVTADLSPGVLVGDLESWRLACTAGAFFLGFLMVLSTYGRYRKAKAARAAPAEPTKPNP